MAEGLLARRRIALVLATTTGGTGRHVRAVVDAALTAGAGVTVAGPATTDVAFGFTSGGARFVPVEIGVRPRPFRDLATSQSLRSATVGCDLVHAHGLRAAFLVAVRRRSDVPLVTTWHNAVLSGGRLQLVAGGLERLVARRADVTLCVSGDLETRVRSLGGRDVRLAPVGSVPLRRTGRSAADVRAELALEPGRPLVLSIGRLHRQKGFDTLVAAAALARHQPRPHFVVAGDGPDREQLSRLIRELAAPVHLVGWRDDGGDLLSAADLVAMPSRWEGSPLAAHETLLAGRPLVATAVGGLPQLLAGGAARLVAPDDPAALAAAIDALLGEPQALAALARAGEERGREWPDGPTAARAVVDVYAELLGPAR
ncbi:MAG TPA: glycosyltransferase family 4 protein [Mycobacteriales bacterium]|nr:glycosyltransferase family 4 protein [Mycobacteriales bacterium]